MSDEEDTLLEFPCDFPIKAFGHDTGDFGALVMELVRQHAPETGEEAMHTRPSRGGRYVAVTVTVRAHSRAQLDSIYHALTAEERVLVAL